MRSLDRLNTNGRLRVRDRGWGHPLHSHALLRHDVPKDSPIHMIGIFAPQNAIIFLFVKLYHIDIKQNFICSVEYESLFRVWINHRNKVN
jgi:hypothetical protein